MNAARWKRLRAAVEAALDARREDRDAVLADACADDPTLLSEARSVIQVAEETGGFLEPPLRLSETLQPGEEGPAPVERWQRIRRIFEGSVPLAAKSRPSFLDQECAGDPESRAAVEALLAALESANTFVEGSEVAVHVAGEDLQASDAAFGPFRLLRRLGAGGMGEVYLAEDSRLHRRVALKFVRPELAADTERLWRFEREALAAAALNHPNVATIYEVGEAGGRRYIAMEYVEGVSLDQHLRSRSLDLREVIAIAIEVADALDEAHAKGIVHRDVKPSNVMITPRGHAKVLDFGIAKLAAQLDPAGSGGVPLTPETRAGGLLGTVSYMSPEQAQGLPVDARSDIFGFGVTLYEMATGHLPFEGPTQEKVLQLIVEADATRISRHNPSLPFQFVTLVGRCLEKEPAKRYQTAGDLITDLRTIHNGIDSPPRTGVHTRLFGYVAKRRGLAVAAAALATLLLGTRMGRIGNKPSAISLLILPMEFRGESTDPQYVGRSFSEALAVNLAEAEGLNVLPVPETREAGQKGGLDSSAEAQRLGAAYFIAGRIERERTRFSLTVSLVETARNRIAWGANARPFESLSAAASQIAPELASRLGIAQGGKQYDYFMYLTGPPEMARSPELMESLGAIRRGEIAAALEVTGRLLARFPLEPDAHVLRAGALLGEAVEVSAEAVERQRLDDELIAIDQVDPLNPWDEIFRALCLSNDGRSTEAIELFGKVLSRKDLTQAARGNVLILRGTAEAGLGDSESAIRDLEEARRLEPANDITLSLGGGILLQLGRNVEALDLIQQAVSLNPLYDQSQWYLGHAFRALGRWEEAVPPFALGCSRSRLQSNCGDYAIALLQAGQVRESEAAARGAASLKEGHWGTYILACYWALAGRRDEARRMLSRAIELGWPRQHVGLETECKMLRTDPAFREFVGPGTGPAQ